MKKLFLLFPFLFLVGCDTVPQSVKEVIQGRQAAIMAVHEDAVDYAGEHKIEVDVWLPAGTYTIAEDFQIARVSIPMDMTAGTLATVTALNNIPIPENVAITGLRVLAPLVGFGIGAWQNVEINKSSNSLLSDIAAGTFGLSQTAITTPPTIVQ